MQTTDMKVVNTALAELKRQRTGSGPRPAVCANHVGWRHVRLRTTRPPRRDFPPPRPGLSGAITHLAVVDLAKPVGKGGKFRVWCRPLAGFSPLHHATYAGKLLAGFSGAGIKIRGLGGRSRERGKRGYAPA
jgi:hypothetical protein